MGDVLQLSGAFAASIVGMGWLALGLKVHWRQVHGGDSRPQGVKALRVLGGVALGVSLVLCLSVDHASMASLVWIMTLAASAFIIAFTLSWRPTWLRVLFPSLWLIGCLPISGFGVWGRLTC